MARTEFGAYAKKELRSVLGFPFILFGMFGMLVLLFGAWIAGDVDTRHVKAFFRDI
jgi:hypothetical protein